MKRLVRVGSRESALAVAQAKHVIECIKRRHPELELELVTMKTSGDLHLDGDLSAIGGKGLFVKELDGALLDGRIDIAVHSLKDMPAETPEELPILCYTRRENPYDALILPAGSNSLDLTRPFGSSSARRRLQLMLLYPGARFEGLRGNIPTRLEKLDGGKYAAAVLACAGLVRLGLGRRISRVFTEREMIPAAGQGILAVQGRRGEDHSYLSCVDDPASRAAATAERAFVRRLGAGCFSPAAAFAKVSGGTLLLHGLHCDEGSGRHVLGRMEMPASDAEKLGLALAERLLLEISG